MGLVQLIQNSVAESADGGTLLFMGIESMGISKDQLARLRTNAGCEVSIENDARYEQSRRIWNGMIDRKPSAVVHATSLHNVMQAVRFAREENLNTTIRGGGHSVAGKSVADGALMIDLSRMSEVQVDPIRGTAVAQGGATWGIFDREAQKHGLATTGGVISSTGVCGLTLGGGIGWLMGKHSLSCDNVLSADLVNADGEHVFASRNENEDLFWAIRGGGGNFGIVTALEFQLHELAMICGGIMLYPRADASDLLRQYRDITLTAPDTLTAYAALMVGHGHPMAGVAMCHSGPEREGEAACRQFQLSKTPAVDMVGTKKYTDIQTMLDFTAPAGLRYYFKCPFLRELSDDAIDLILAYAAKSPTEQTQIVIEHMHGAASRVPVADTAFGLRRVHYSINIMPAWNDAELTEKCVSWAQEFADSLKEFGASDAYVNYLSEEGSGAVKSSYGANFERLAALKRKYDPDNFFRFNQNIPPAA